MKIRLAQPRDYDDILHILTQVQDMHIAWRPDIYRPNDRLLTKEDFARLIGDKLIYAAEDEGRVRGFMQIMYRHVENPAQVTRDTLYIETMAVQEGYRGRGVGHLFFQLARELKAERNLDAIELQVNARNEDALEMYKKCGFTVKTYFMELL